MKLYLATALVGGYLAYVELIENEKGELICSERGNPVAAVDLDGVPGGYQPKGGDEKRNDDMRNNNSAQISWHAVRALALTAVPVFLLVQSSVAQNAARIAGKVSGNDVNKTYQTSDKDTRPYDKHDFNGLWARNPSPIPPAPVPGMP